MQAAWRPAARILRMVQASGRPADTGNRLLTVKVKNIFYESRRVYGARKIQALLRKEGVHTSRKRLRRLMRGPPFVVN